MMFVGSHLDLGRSQMHEVMLLKKPAKLPPGVLGALTITKVPVKSLEHEDWM